MKTGEDLAPAGEAPPEVADEREAPRARSEIPKGETGDEMTETAAPTRIKLGGATYGGAGASAPAPAAAQPPAAAPAPGADVPAQIARLEEEARAAAEAAREAYSTGHGRVPASNAGELLARAAEAARKLAAAKGG